MGNAPIDTREGTKNRTTSIVTALIAAGAAITVAVWNAASKREVPPNPIQAGEVQITGRVADAQTDLPIRKAQVSVEAAGIPETTESDSKGIFSAKLPAGYSAVRIRIAATGFKPYDQLLPRDPSNQIVHINLDAQSGTAKRHAAPGANGRDATALMLSPSAGKLSMASMLNASLPVVSGDRGPWAVIIFGDQDRRDDVSASLRSALGESGHDTVSLFRRVADEQRSAPDVFRGSSDFLRDLQAGRFCSRILVGKLSVVRAGTTEGITFAKATLTVHILSAAGETLKDFVVAEKGGGEDDSSARRHAIDELLESIPRELPGKIN
jgi:hypothetical protein